MDIKKEPEAHSEWERYKQSYNEIESTINMEERFIENSNDMKEMSIFQSNTKLRQIGKPSSYTSAPCLEIQIDEADVKKEMTYPYVEDSISVNCQIRLNCPVPALVPRLILNRIPLYRNYFVCHVCDDTFPTFTEQRRHKDIHKSLTSYVVKDETDVNSLNVSFEDDSTEPSGEDCGYTWKTKQLLMQPNDKAFKSDASECSSKLSIDIKKYKSVSSVEKLHICEVCKYSCARSSKMKNHKMIHSGEKPFKCEQCDYSCVQASNLKIHKRIHSGEKLFKCDQCEYSCIHSSNMRRHQMIHTGDKLYKCGECNYSCVRSNHMKKHKMIHSGEKPFKCDICDYSCIQSSNFKIHKRIHSREKLFKCDKCDYSCIQSGNLKRHKSIHK